MKRICIFLSLIINCGLVHAVTQTTSSQDKPSYVYLNTYTENLNSQVTRNDTLGGPDPGSIQENFTCNMSGAWDSANTGTYSYVTADVVNGPWGFSQTIDWNISDRWPAATETDIQKFIDYYGTTTLSTNSLPNQPPPYWDYEYCDVGFSDYSQVPTTYDIGWNDSAVTTSTTTHSYCVSLKLKTGGKGISKLRNLFDISSQVYQISEPVAAANFGAAPWMFLNQYGPYYDGSYYLEGDGDEAAVPNQDVAIGSLGNQGSDGNLYVGLWDNDDVDITPLVIGMEHYTFWVTAQKYKLHIWANGYPLANDRVRPAAHYAVGQRLDFSQSFTPSLPVVPQYSPVQWAFGGTYVTTNIPPANVGGSTNYVDDPDLLETTNARAWWISGGLNPASTYSALVGEGLTFPNGQYAVVTAGGNFTMFCPQILGHGFIYPGQIRLITSTLPEVGLGMVGGAQYISWRTQVGLDTNFPAHLFHVQILNGGYYWDVPYFTINCLDHSSTTSDAFWLDNSSPYESDGGTPVNTAPVYMTTNAAITFSDGPEIRGTFCSFGQITFDFYTYLFFQPSNSGSIPVPLEHAEWLMDARTDGVGTNWTLTVTNMAGPFFTTDSSFPQWPHTYLNSNKP